MEPYDVVCRNRLLFAFFKPNALVRLSKEERGNRRLRILDLGCGNHSPRFFRTQFPSAWYVGVDRGVSNNTASDLAVANAVFDADLETTDLGMVSDGDFDIVVLSHVLEHLRNWRQLLTRAMEKVRPGGLLYVAHPHSDSVGFPSRKETLNFYDDPTHVSVIQPGEVCRILGASGFERRAGGISRLPRNLFTMPLKAVASLLLDGVTGPMLWDLYGFEEFCLVRRAGVGTPSRPANLS